MRSFSRSETADLYDLFKRLECFAVELSVPQMSDRDIRRFEDMLIEAGAALQRGDAKTYAMRDREIYENLAEQSENSALIEALARVALQIQLCSTMASVGPEFAERAAHGCDDIIQAFKARDTLRAAFSFAAASAIRRRRSLRAFPKRQRLAKAGIISRLSESCHRTTLTSAGSGNSTER